MRKSTKQGGLAEAGVFTGFTRAGSGGLGYAPRQGHYAPAAQHQRGAFQASRA
jgi:hypothetical protein